MSNNLDTIKKIKARIAELEDIIRSARSIYYRLPADAPDAERAAAQSAYVDPQIEQSKLWQQLQNL